nr:DUF1735 domain-containing protein [uncultured Bacteroides sp.]
MKKNICYYFLLAGSLLLTQSACEDGREDYLSDFNTILSFRNSGEIALDVYKTGFKTDYSVIVNKSGWNVGATTSVNAGVMSEVELLAYNTAEGSDYKALSEGYTFTGGELQFASSDLYKTMNLSLDPEVIEANLDANGTYVVPLELFGSADSINAEKDKIFLVPNVKPVTVGFQNSGYTVVSVVLDDNETVELTAGLTLPVGDLWNLKCGLEVDEAALDEYNAANKTSFKLLNPVDYDLNKDITFTTGSKTAAINITLKKTNLEYGQYVLPLRLKTTSDSHVLINEESDLMLFGVSYAIQRSKLKEIPLSIDMLSSNATVDGDGTGLEGLFDGRAADKHWHGNYSGTGFDPVYGQYIDFHLKNAINHFAYDFWTRFENSNGAPKSTDIYVSNDGSTWIKLATVATTFTKGDEEYNSDAFSSKTSFTYVRFAVTMSNGGDCCTSAGYWNCGEMKIYGL